MICDFCGEESATVGFDPEYDAAICDTCKDEIDHPTTRYEWNGDTYVPVDEDKEGERK